MTEEAAFSEIRFYSMIFADWRTHFSDGNWSHHSHHWPPVETFDQLSAGRERLIPRLTEARDTSQTRGSKCVWRSQLPFDPRLLEESRWKEPLQRMAAPSGVSIIKCFRAIKWGFLAVLGRFRVFQRSLIEIVIAVLIALQTAIFY